MNCEVPTRRVAQLFRALRLSIVDLSKYYQDRVKSTPPPGLDDLGADRSFCSEHAIVGPSQREPLLVHQARRGAVGQRELVQVRADQGRGPRSVFVSGLRIRITRKRARCSRRRRLRQHCGTVRTKRTWGCGWW